MIIEGDVHIQRAPREVFDFLAYADRWAEVDRAIRSMTVSGPLALGSSGSVIYRRSGLKVTTAFEVTAFEPGERLQILTTGTGYELREDVLFEAADGGTRLSVTDTLEPTSVVGRMLVAISGRTVRRDLEARRANLKKSLEQGRAPSM
jgi:Polyketide cyclase / dehydrase and lipid transport